MAERSIALLHRCGCTGANRRTCLIWSATELSVSAVPARAWVFLRQRRSRRELSLSNTKAASLRPSRPINLRPEATAISSRSTAVGRSTERAERTSDVTQIIEADTIGHKVIIRAIKNIRAGAEITYNYGRDYLINVITRRGCKCDKCRKRRADVRAKARPKSRRAPRSRRRKGKNAGNDCRQEPDRDLRTEDRSIWSTPDTEWLYSGGSNNEFKR